MKILTFTDENDLSELYVINSDEDLDKAVYDYFKDLLEFIYPSDEFKSKIESKNITGLYRILKRDCLENYNLNEYHGVNIQDAKTFN